MIGTFFKDFLNDFKKFDTILAFSVSFILNYLLTKDFKQTLIFSILFVIIFLLLLNLFT